MAFFYKAGNILRHTKNKHIISEMSVASPPIFQMIRNMSNWKVFVGGIGPATNDINLKEAFSAFGEVSEAKVVKGRGFGFVTFAENESAYEAYQSGHNAIEAMDQWELHGRTVTVNWANDSDGHVPPSQFTDEEWDRHFEAIKQWDRHFEAMKQWDKPEDPAHA